MRRHMLASTDMLLLAIGSHCHSYGRVWFLARRTLEALTPLLLHSSASHKASVCSNWLWIKSYWLEVRKINKHNEAALCVYTSKSWPGARYRNSKTTEQQLLRGKLQMGHPFRLSRAFFLVFILQSIKVSSWNWWQCLRYRCTTVNHSISSPWAALFHFAH